MDTQQSQDEKSLLAIAAEGMGNLNRHLARYNEPMSANHIAEVLQKAADGVAWTHAREGTIEDFDDSQNPPGRIPYGWLLVTKGKVQRHDLLKKNWKTVHYEWAHALFLGEDVDGDKMNRWQTMAFRHPDRF